MAKPLSAFATNEFRGAAWEAPSPVPPTGPPPPLPSPPETLPAAPSPSVAGPASPAPAQRRAWGRVQVRVIRGNRKSGPPQALRPPVRPEGCGGFGRGREPTVGDRLRITDHRLPTPHCGLTIDDCGVPITDYGLPITDYRSPTPHCGLTIDDWGAGGAGVVWCGVVSEENPRTAVA